MNQTDVLGSKFDIFYMFRDTRFRVHHDGVPAIRTAILKRVQQIFYGFERFTYNGLQSVYTENG